MFNHLSDAHDAAVDVLAAVLGEDRPAAPPPRPGAGLARRLHRAGDRPRGAHRMPPRRPGPPALRPFPGTARPAGRRHGQRRQRRPAAARRWRPVDGPPAREPQPRACSPATARPPTTSPAAIAATELDAELTVADAGGVLYGGFSGFLGQGRMETARPGRRRMSGCCPARARWTTRRPATGRWRSDATRSGAVAGVEVGCWLARRLPYERIG